MPKWDEASPALRLGGETEPREACDCLYRIHWSITSVICWPLSRLTISAAQRLSRMYCCCCYCCWRHQDEAWRAGDQSSSAWLAVLSTCCCPSVSISISSSSSSSYLHRAAIPIYLIFIAIVMAIAPGNETLIAGLVCIVKVAGWPICIDRESINDEEVERESQQHSHTAGNPLNPFIFWG